MRHNEKSENIARGRRFLVVASQTVGVVAVHRPHRHISPKSHLQQVPQVLASLTQAYASDKCLLASLTQAYASHRLTCVTCLSLCR